MTTLLMTAPGAFARPLGGQAPTPSAAAITAQSAQQEAARAASQSSDALKRATLAIQAQQASQQAARDAARAAANASSIPNGLAVGGLQRAAGAVPGTDLWHGANLPTQFTDGDRVKVNIGQTQQKAILTWDTFNVGARTDLRFDQHGNRDWVALNRVLGTDARPSQILGSIKADGSVYVINQNGIIFGGGSQINVGALIASTAKISNDQFLRGVYSSGSGSDWTPSFTDAAELLNNGRGGGVVKVEAGAQIATHAPASVTSGGGFVLLMGGQVVNAGSITTPNGQAQLAAGDDFVLRRGYGTEENLFSTTRGNEIAPLFRANSLAGLVRNEGTIFSAQGDITLAGRAIEQDGILVASTSVNTRGTIHLLNSATDALGSITLGADSVTTIIPELESEETALNSQRDGLIAASEEANRLRTLASLGQFDNLSLLADRLDQSRIEIVTGGNVIFKGGVTPESGSLTIAQGGQVAVSAGGRIFTEGGAIIDVSGVRDVSLAMSANNLMVNIQGNELRDSPQNRDSNALKNANVWVDIRDLIYVPWGTGGYDGDRYYTPGGLLEVGGYLANTRHKVGEWSAVGGMITLSAPEVIAQQGSVFDISGGSVRYEAGTIRTTNFLGSDGRLYNINDARADMTFYGLGQGFIRKHERWGVTEVWTNPFGRGRESVRWEEGYTVGRDAGRLILSTPTAVFEADILADIVQGKRQDDARPDGVTDGYKIGQTEVAKAGQLLVGAYGSLGRMGVHDTEIVIGDIADITAGLDASSILAADRVGTLYLDAARLNEQKLGGIDLATGNVFGSTTRGTIKIESDLRLADGGSLDLTAPVIDIRANVGARGGSVVATDNLMTREVQGDSVVTRTTALTKNGTSAITLRNGATIDTRGLWTSVLLDPSELRGLALIDGGNVTLAGNATVEADALIDASAGGSIARAGEIAFGHGGDIALGDIGPGAITGQTNDGVAKLLGTVRSYGGTGGGLYLQAGSVLITDAGIDPQGATLLTPNFFQQGFSSYTINGLNGLRVAETDVEVVQPVYQATSALYGLPTGSDIASLVDLVLYDVYRESPAKGELIKRPGADLTLSSGAMHPNIARALVGGNLRIDEGASITVDPGRKITIASGGQITVNGSVTAHGGEIAILNEGQRPAGSVGGLSIWIGEHARLDASARAVTATDTRGRLYGVVPDGGTTVLGSRGGEDPDIDNAYRASPAFIVIREGAVLDVSGASADLSFLNTGASSFFNAGANTNTRTVASSGGSITLDSYSGIYNDGTLLGRAGGAGASGGSLTLNLEAPILPNNANQREQAGRVLHIAQGKQESLLPDNLAAGAAHNDLKPGYANLSAEEIAEGGFDDMSLFARTAIVFDGDVNLTAGRSIALRTSGLYNSANGAHATASAPYVALDGQFVLQAPQGMVLPSVLPTPAWPETGSITIEGGLIDVVNRMNAHVAKLTLASTGDLRFLAFSLTPSDIGASNRTKLGVSGDLALIARRIYPATNAMVEIYAGTTIADADGRLETGAYGTPNTATITIGRSPDGAPVAVPYSVFGSLEISAGSIFQGGNLFAPLGELSLIAAGSDNRPAEGRLVFQKGSITSISARGLVIPYGGTTDGVNYTADGLPVGAYNLINALRAENPDPGATSTAVPTDEYRGRIVVGANTVISESGSVLDVSGGGDLQGAAFISGRGGSVDTLLHPLIAANPANTYSASGNKVYAIVPGVDVSPVAGGAANAWTGAIPSVGERITIPEGVPNLPAGTYTLLPANYALLVGGYRVELGTRGTSYGPTTSLANGSYIASVTRSVAGSAISDALFTKAIVTPGGTMNAKGERTFGVVGSYAQYNGQGYADFLLAQAATFNSNRPLLPADGKFLTFELQPLLTGSAPVVESALQFNGTARFSPSEGGYGGTAAIYAFDRAFNAREDLTITRHDTATARSSSLTTVRATDIAGLEAPSLTMIFVPNLTLESGVTLSGSQIILTTDRLLVEEGASISTIGHDQWVPNLRTPGEFTNGSIFLSAAEMLKLGEDTSFYSKESISFSSTNSIEFPGSVRLGTRDLHLGLSYVNIGNAHTLAAAKDAGILPVGLSLDEALLATLLAGDPVTGVPGMKNLILSATKSVNLYGDMTLSTRDLDSFQLTAPAIYGQRVDGHDANFTMLANRLVWSSTAALPGSTLVNGQEILGTGQGIFNIDAREIVLGNSTASQVNRLMLGFSEVNLKASDYITSTGANTLSVWRSGASPAAGFDPASYVGSAAAKLNLVTPLLTGNDASQLAVYTGGDLRIAALEGSAPADTAAISTLGATIELKSVLGSVILDTAVALPSGKLTAIAHDDVQLTGRSRLDLAGRTITFFDVEEYSWGGDVVLESTHGDIVQASGSIIDVSAGHNDAGSITLTATSDSGGTVLLGGTLRGHGGAGYTSGGIDLRAQTIGANAAILSADFSALNNALTTGGFFGTRAFQFKQGDLTVGDGVKARNVVLSVDNGNLTVTGRIDASGKVPGSIRLSAQDDLTLSSTAVLDVRGTELQTDSDSAVVEAKNRGSIELTTTGGWLRLDEGARFDLSSPDGAARGKVALNVRRTSETGGDAAIDAAGPLDIRGAKEIALNAFWTYSPTDADGTIVQDNGSRVNGNGNPLNAEGELGLNQIFSMNDFFTFAARDNADFLGRLSGLTAYGDAFHLRAGVEILGGDTSGGNLTIKGDLDLAQTRTFGLNQNADTENPAEPGSLVIRAPGNLTVNGSVSDGFDLTADVPTYGRVLESNKTLTTAWTADRSGLVLGADSQIPNSGSLNFDVVAGTGTRLTKGAVTTAEAVVSSNSVNLPLNTVVTSNVYDAQGNLKWAAGTVLSSSTAANRQLRSGDRISAGFTVPTAATANILVVGTTIAAGTDLAMFQFAANPYIQIQGITLSPGNLLPAGTLLTSLAETAKLVAGAKPLAVGAKSWSIRMVAGADRQSADSRVVRTLMQLGGSGNMVLSNPITDANGRSLPNVIRTGTGDLDLIAGRDLTQDTPFGVYTAGTQIDVGTAYSGVTSQGGYFTEGGGDVHIAAGRNLVGNVWSEGSINNYAVGDWLVRQGNASTNTPAAWGIRFGAFGGVNGSIFYGFSSGFGALGGGNLTVDAGNDATNLNLAVASTGRVATDAGGMPSLTQTGGGDLLVGVGHSFSSQFAALTNLRGDIRVRAGTIGGAVAVIGDGSADFQARGGLGLAGAGNPGLLAGAGTTGYFSLWRSDTATRLMSAGGNVSLPYDSNRDNVGYNAIWQSESSGINRVMLPPIFEAVAANGDLSYGGGSRIELAPSRDGYLELLAGGSIIGSANTSVSYVSPPAAWNVSGADPDLISNPFRPSTSNTYFSVQAADTVTTNLHEGDDKVIRVYARDGDIVNFALGTPPNSLATIRNYAAAMPARIVAGRDIVNFGNNAYRSNFTQPEYQVPGLIMNNDTTDVSVIRAGRDIFYADVQIAGPGSLDVIAGRNLYLGSQSSVVSIGDIIPSDGTSPGASILMQAGTGPNGPNYAGLLRYLDPANLAVYGTPLIDQPGKVAKTYEMQLAAWLKERFKYNSSGVSDALAYFTTLAPEQQTIFLRTVYFEELRESGREYTGKLESTRLGSYIRGQKAIEALFPDTDEDGNPISYVGDITLFSTKYVQHYNPQKARWESVLHPSDGSVRTHAGGDIQFLAPGGQIVVGVEGVVPGANAGVMTQFGGGIQMYSQGSILLGLSRIMTNFGDDIFAWSEYGDINAGRGAKTTIGYTPPRRDYDDYGNVSLMPSVPQAGAGISARSGVPGVNSGDIDLHARRGTIDVGEAGIAGRNINISALQIINAANITAQGNVTGVPTIQAPPVAALTSSNNLTAATQQVQQAAPSNNDRPSIIMVEFLGFGGGDGSAPETSPSDIYTIKKRQSYNSDSPLQVVGLGEMTSEQQKQLIERAGGGEGRKPDAPVQ